ncbi:MAG: sulfatase-like hydrolase/transferase, partial [Verrucomicrobiia bacterium]
FIGESKGKPWFLYLAFNAPHGASTFGSDPSDRKSREGVQAPEKYVAMYRGKVKDERLAKYYGAVTCMDEAIGDIIAHLKQNRLGDDTVLMFLSDNGGSGNGGNAPLKAGKSTMWEGGLRVPFIAWWPGHVPAGKVTDEFLTSLELLPTLAAVAGTTLPPDVKLDGFDLLPVLRGERKSPRAEMFWQRRGDKAARIGQWKWVESGKGRGLFDLSADLVESRDLSLEKPDVLARVKARFEAWKKEMDAAEPRGPFRDY